MDFSFDDAQQAVAELAAGVLRAEPDHGRTSAALAAAPGYDETAWKAMGQAGLLSLAVPEACGGDGFGPVETGIVLTEVGRQILPLPALATLALGVLPLARFGSTEEQAVLGDIATGRVLSAAVRTGRGVGVRLDGDRLTGVRVGVPYAAQAHRVLVPTDAGTALVDPHAGGTQLQQTPTSTGAPEYTMRFTGAVATQLLDAGPADLDRYAVAGAAAMADGVIAGALALTADHLRTREQFGRPLATFQAVAQQIADVYVVARTVHLAAVSAAWRLGNGLDADEDLAVAAYWLAAELPKALQVCHHLHGGLGVDITYPLHRYYSQGKDLARFVGGAAYRLELLGKADAKQVRRKLGR